MTNGEIFWTIFTSIVSSIAVIVIVFFWKHLLQSGKTLLHKVKMKAKELYNEFPYRVYNKSKSGDAFLHTYLDNGQWTYDIIRDDANSLVIHIGRNHQDIFPTEESLLHYVTFGNKKKLVKKLGETKNGEKISKSYRIAERS